MREAVGEALGRKAAEVRADLTREIDFLKRELGVLREEVAAASKLKALREEIAAAQAAVPKVPDIVAGFEAKQAETARAFFARQLVLWMLAAVSSMPAQAADSAWTPTDVQARAGAGLTVHLSWTAHAPDDSSVHTVIKRRNIYDHAVLSIGPPVAQLSATATSFDDDLATAGTTCRGCGVLDRMREFRWTICAQGAPVDLSPACSAEVSVDTPTPTLGEPTIWEVNPAPDQPVLHVVWQKIGRADFYKLQVLGSPQHLEVREPIAGQPKFLSTDAFVDWSSPTDFPTDRSVDIFGGTTITLKLCAATDAGFPADGCVTRAIHIDQRRPDHPPSLTRMASNSSTTVALRWTGHANNASRYAVWGVRLRGRRISV